MKNDVEIRFKLDNGIISRSYKLSQLVEWFDDTIFEDPHEDNGGLSEGF